jgi:hypothetical protein
MVGNRLYLQMQKNLLDNFSAGLKRELNGKSYCLPDFSQLSLNDVSMSQNHLGLLKGWVQPLHKFQNKQDMVALLNKVKMVEPSQGSNNSIVNFEQGRFSKYLLHNPYSVLCLFLLTPISQTNDSLDIPAFQEVKEERSSAFSKHEN